LQLWCEIKKLTVNATKSVYMFITKSHVCIESDNLLMNNGEPLKREERFKFLGLILDKHLSCGHHIESVIRKVTFLSRVFFPYE